MPSGITHMMISQKTLDYIADEDASNILQSERGPFMLGCVSPDLPYMTLLDTKVWENRKGIADDFHYKRTNEIPLEGLRLTKKYLQNNETNIANTLFAFYVGYASHIVADGIIHPYVRDKVGDYEVAATAHRTLEMKLDVLLADFFFDQEINNINFHDELSWIKDCANQEEIFKSFSSFIDSVYQTQVSPEEIKKWLSTMDMVFDITTGKFPFWYQKLLGDSGLAFNNVENILSEKEKLTTLTLPIDYKEKSLSTNYMQKEKVDFFEDVLPHYFSVFSRFILDAYSFVYADGPEDAIHLPPINLDTGRIIGQNLENKPKFLELA
ncbi:MAG: zinc dependent phospholipase C family protein [Pseudobdellovibrionaceae bacterium]